MNTNTSEDKVTESSSILRYIIYSLVVIVIWLICCINIAKPTLYKLHRVAIMPITVSDGLLEYVGSVTDYYNSLIGITNTTTDNTIVLLIVLFALVVVALYGYVVVKCKRIDKCVKESEVLGSTPNKGVIELRKVFKTLVVIVSLLFVGVLLESPTLLKINKAKLSREVAGEFQISPISKKDLESKIGVIYNDDGSKSLKISKKDFNKSLKASNYDYTVDDIKVTGKLDVLNILNELYYKIYEDDAYLGYSTNKTK